MDLAELDALLRARPRELERFSTGWDAPSSPLDALARRLDPQRSPEMRELELVVHARPDGPDGEARQAEATERLRELLAASSAESRALDDAINRYLAPPPEPEPLPAARRWPAVALASLLVAGLAVGAGIERTQPADSLAVFDRPQTEWEAQYLENDPVLAFTTMTPGSMRFLAGNAIYAVVGYLLDGAALGSTDDHVCMYVEEIATRTTTNNCTTITAFRESGIIGVPGISWGPTGDLRFTTAGATS